MPAREYRIIARTGAGRRARVECQVDVQRRQRRGSSLEPARVRRGLSARARRTADVAGCIVPCQTRTLLSRSGSGTTRSGSATTSMRTTSLGAMARRISASDQRRDPATGQRHAVRRVDLLADTVRRGDVATTRNAPT